ncbi:MAG: hypothetical protein RBR78_09360 [Flavobacteriaceae bacterium]|nr:hypothetical protein [Flavobacteriaceae bacterium]
MRKFLQLVFVLFLATTSVYATDFESIRKNYDQFVSDKELCQKTLKQLSESKNDSALHQAYLGVLETVWANHVISPFKKLKTFKSGKQNIDAAIGLEPENVEIRFIRLSVQKNAPSFLGYNNHIKEDTAFIKKNRHLVTSVILNKHITSLLNE